MAATDNSIAACKVRLINWLARDKSEEGQKMADDILDNRGKFDAAVSMVHARLNNQPVSMTGSLDRVVSEIMQIMLIRLTHTGGR